MVLLGVVGASKCSPEIEALAYEVGSEIASRGAGLICGGLGGVMGAASRGAREQGGVAIGILPGNDVSAADPGVTIPIVTGLGEARNLVIVKSSRALVAIGGEYGTLSEIAFALKLGVPVVGLRTWELTAPGALERAPIHVAENAREAVETALRLAAARPAVPEPPVGNRF